MRRYQHFARTIPAVAVVAAMLLACSGGEAADVEDGPDASASAESDPSSAVQDSGDSGSSDVVAPDAEQMFARFGEGLSRPGQVVYEWRDAGSGVVGQMTIAQDPPNVATRMESSDGAFHSITGDVNAICFVADGEWQCMPADSGMGALLGGNPLDDVYDFDDVEASNVDLAAITFSAETIVGRSATCMSIPETDGASNLVMCVDDETGMMLRTSGDTPEGSFSMEAILFTQPDPSMFTPPGEMMTLPAIPTG